MSNKMTLKEFFSKVEEVTKDHPHLRYGQASYAVLHNLRPELAEIIRCTDMDPFYLSDQHRLSSPIWNKFAAFLTQNL